MPGLGECLAIAMIENEHNEFFDVEVKVDVDDVLVFVPR